MMMAEILFRSCCGGSFCLLLMANILYFTQQAMRRYTNNNMHQYIDDPLVLLSLSSFPCCILVLGCFCSVAVNCQPLNFEKGFC